MDNRRQVGKYLNHSQEQAEFALKKPHKVAPKIERIRDIFDSYIEFEMQFTTDENEDVVMDIYFKPPPPLTECCSQCYCIVCEFVESAGEIVLERPYEPGSVMVFVDDVLIPGAIIEIDPNEGTVEFTGSFGANMRVCYTYNYGGCQGA